MHWIVGAGAGERGRPEERSGSVNGGHRAGRGALRPTSTSLILDFVAL
jgi:hypothetical protein